MGETVLGNIWVLTTFVMATFHDIQCKDVCDQSSLWSLLFGAHPYTFTMPTILAWSELGLDVIIIQFSKNIHTYNWHCQRPSIFRYDDTGIYNKLSSDQTPRARYFEIKDNFVKGNRCV